MGILAPEANNLCPAPTPHRRHPPCPCAPHHHLLLGYLPPSLYFQQKTNPSRSPARTLPPYPPPRPRPEKQKIAETSAEQISPTDSERSFQGKTPWIGPACAGCPGFLVPGAAGAPAPKLHPRASDHAPELAFASWPPRADSWICYPQLPCHPTTQGGTS